MTVAAARPTVLVSTPTTRLDFAACVLPMAQHRPFQALFGYEGQLAALAAGLAAAGLDCALLPAPELFGHPTALAAIRARLGADHPLVHLRFGAPGAARLLKGARNLFVAGDDAMLPAIDLGWHPFGGGDRLPPLMAGVLSYGERHRPLLDLAGTPVPATSLPAAASSADLDLARPARNSLTGLQVQSLAEFSRLAWSQSAWSQAAAPAEQDGALPLRSADLHAALAGIAPRRLIALPWNLAHPGGIVADLAVKLARRRDPAVGLLLLPFNVNAASGGASGGDALEAVPQLAGHMRAATDAPGEALRASFVGRLRTPQGAHALRRIAPTAWVDGSDPEAGWTLRRLERLGIAAILIAGGLQPPPPGTCTFHADSWMQTELHTPFGRRLQRAATVSARRLGALLDLEPAAAPPPPGATAAALGEAMRPLARTLLPGFAA